MADPRGAAKWWVYQRERFPVVAHGALIAAFSASAVGFTALLRGLEPAPAWPAFAVAFVNSFLSFLQLRIADEFKDIEEDTRYRPYRAVPRGLVTLRELGWLGAGTAVVQAVLAAVWAPRLLGLLLLNWTYLALMSREFFAREWLRGRPVTYLLSHMLIMPLIDFYATACDWVPAAGHPPRHLFAFVIVSFCNGVVIEIGRKIRAPEQEELGVQTYSFLWGPTRAAAVWLVVLGLTGSCAVWAAGPIGFQVPVRAALGALWLAAAALVLAFARRRVNALARWFEPLSGVWTIVLYLILGAIPFLLRALGARGP